jgi:hypothetical protein
MRRITIVSNTSSAMFTAELSRPYSLNGGSVTFLNQIMTDVQGTNADKIVLLFKFRFI